MTERTTKITAMLAAIAFVFAIAVTDNYDPTHVHTYAAVVKDRPASKAPIILETYDNLGETMTIVPDPIEVVEMKEVEHVALASAPVHNSSGWFSNEYLMLQHAIKDYADECTEFDFHGVTFDGLAVMAQANCESAYMCDKTQSLTALYPSTFVPLTCVEDIEEMGIDKVWGNPSALTGTYLEMPFWSTGAGPFYAWSTGSGVYEQGPLQQRVTPDHYDVLEDSESEYEKLVRTGTLTIAENTVYGYEATSLCTGTEYLDNCLGYETVGDRWSIEDNCKIWRATKLEVLEELWDEYYSTCGYTPSKEEYLAILSYAHWIPSVIMGNTKNSTVQYYGFSYNGAWFELCHQLASEEALTIIREHAIDNIEENRTLHYEEDYTKEQCNQLLSVNISAGSTTDPEGSEPWQIFNECVAAGIVDASLIIEQPDYGYQHAMKYAIQYLYAYEMLELLLEGY